MDSAGNIAAVRVTQAMQGVQARFAEIESRTGLSFSGFMMRSQLLQSVSGRKAGATAVASVPENDDEVYETLGPDDEPSGDVSVSAGASPVSRGNAFSRLPDSAYDGLFEELANRYGLNAALVKAVCFAESNFRPGAVSKAGAMGLMQLMPYTADALGVEDPFDPFQNVDGGTRLLAQLLDRFDGDALLAVAAYNCGPNGVSSRGITDLSDPGQRALLPAETRGYLSRIEQYLQAAQALYVLDSPYEA